MKSLILCSKPTPLPSQTLGNVTDRGGKVQNSNLPKLSLYIVNSRNQNENFVYEVKKTIGLIDRSPNDRSNRPV